MGGGGVIGRKLEGSHPAFYFYSEKDHGKVTFVLKINNFFFNNMNQLNIIIINYVTSKGFKVKNIGIH